MVVSLMSGFIVGLAIGYISVIAFYIVTKVFLDL